MYNISYTKLEITKSHAMASGIKDVITVSAEERLIRRSDLSDEFSKIFWISSSRDLYAGATYRAENTVHLAFISKSTAESKYAVNIELNLQLAKV